MHHRYRIAGVVVLYNPKLHALIENIGSYIAQIDHLFVIDNSEKPQEKLIAQIKTFSNARYIHREKNIGLATALNIGAEKALEYGCDYLLTMDQDSKAAPNMVSNLLECLKQHDPKKVAILSPFHVTKNVPPPEEKTCHEVLTVMTSGNLLNLNAYKAVGPFMEDLFIDYVDHEYCLRLHRHGFRVIESSTTLLEHSLGEITVYNLIIGKLGVTNHSPLRRYFMTRNRLYVMHQYRKDYPKYYRSQVKAFIIEFLTIILFENQKSIKLRSILKGYRDYQTGVFGYPKQPW